MTVVRALMVTMFTAVLFAGAGAIIGYAIGKLECDQPEGPCRVVARD